MALLQFCAHENFIDNFINKFQFAGSKEELVSW